MDTIYPIRRSDLTVREVDHETLVLDRYLGKIHQLNATAGYILSCCDGSTSIGEIVRRVASDFGASNETATRDVAAVIKQFRELGLLQG